MRDHPRVCGEKTADEIAKAAFWGSPPRMRGKDIRRRDHLRCHGITPAYAGKSSPKCGKRDAAWDHPRVCGEKKNSFS